MFSSFFSLHGPYIAVYGVKTMYTVVYTACTRPCTWPVHGPYTAVGTIMYTAGHMACTACTQPSRRPVHCRYGRVWAVYTCTQFVYTALYTAYTLSCTRLCTYTGRVRVHDPVHGLYTAMAIFTARTRPCAGRIHGTYSAV